MTTETYSHVVHIVSEIAGELAPEKDAVDLLAGMFPGGTITGCPKVRCMEIIEELEPVRRALYTGSFGCLSKSSMDMNIIIRTILLKGRRRLRPGRRRRSSPTRCPPASTRSPSPRPPPSSNAWGPARREPRLPKRLLRARRGSLEYPSPTGAWPMVTGSLPPSGSRVGPRAFLEPASGAAAPGCGGAVHGSASPIEELAGRLSGV